MKKVYFIFVSLVLFYSSVQAQWNQYLTSQPSLIDEISVVNDNVIWVSDQTATQFSISTDGGSTWVTKNFPVEIAGTYAGPITATSATTAYVIVSSGANIGIYKTIDSGDTWVKQTSGFNAANSFIDCIYFFNENDGVAIGDGNQNLMLEIYTTNNGGSTWTMVPAASLPGTVYDWTLNSNNLIRVHGNTIYVLTGSDKILKSIDKGLNWTSINTPFTNVDINNVSFDFRDDNNGLVTSYNSTTKVTDLYSTADGGANWVKGTSTDVCANLKYIPSEKAYFSMYSGSGMSYSVDYGVTWTKHPSFLNAGVKVAEFTPSGKIFMGGWKYMYTTTNFKGINPALQSVVINNGTNIDLYFDRDVETASAQNIANYVVSYRMPTPPATANTLYPVNILSATQDITNKSLVRLVTAGNMPVDTITFRVNGVKDLTGFPVIEGYKSAISTFVFTSGSWNQYLTNQTSLIDEVSVVNDNVVWITDQDATQFSITTDGGNSWVTKNFPPEIVGPYTGPLTATSATTAYVVVSWDTNIGIYKTIDGGDTWVKQSSGFNAANSFIDAIYFWNENEGVAIGDGFSNLNLEIYTTNNGGAQWTLVPASSLPTSTVNYSYNSNTVIKVHGNTIYVLESSGKILKSADKGLTWTLINTPFNNGGEMSFDFRDDNNGLVANYNTTTNITDLYSTTDGGANWVKGTSANVFPNIKYIPSEKAYLSMHHNFGMSYSLDYGASWTIHPSFRNVGMKTAAVTPSGKIFMGGWQYVYSSINFKGINPALQQVVIKDGTHIDLYFDRDMETTTAQNIANYGVSYRMPVPPATANTLHPINILSATQDNTNKSLVRLVTADNIPVDTINLKIINVKDLNGFPVINGSTSTISSLIYTSAPKVYGSDIQVMFNSRSNELHVSGVQGNAVLNLYDLNGRIILSRKMSGNVSVPVGLLPSGIYLVKLTTMEGSVERKILKN